LCGSVTEGEAEKKTNVEPGRAARLPGQLSAVVRANPGQQARPHDPPSEPGAWARAKACTAAKHPNRSLRVGESGITQPAVAVIS